MAANLICDERDCDHTPERQDCNYNKSHRSYSVNKTSPRNNTCRPSQNNKNVKSLVRSGGNARSIIANVFQRVSAFSPNSASHARNKNGKRRKPDVFSISSVYKRINSVIQSCCCLPIGNFLGKWRFTRDFEWYSTTKYDNRLFSLGNKVNIEFVYLQKSSYNKIN